MAQNNDVDVNTLIKLYNQKIATLTNQNILLEAKLTTVMTDFNDEKTKLKLQQHLSGKQSTKT